MHHSSKGHQNTGLVKARYADLSGFWLSSVWIPTVHRGSSIVLILLSLFVVGQKMRIYFEKSETNGPHHT